MNIVGLVTEYNPFHNGHLFHLNESKKNTSSEYSIAIMSGNFVQRGEPALMDKWTRASMAVKSGVDLVIELPLVYALNSADYFAYGSCSILDKFNVVDQLVFGSESGNIYDFKTIGNFLVANEEQIMHLTKELLKIGNSYPKAREKALWSLIEKSNININLTLNSPNNILGIEYVKNLLKLNSSVTPSTIRRINSDYNSINIQGEFSSATSIRNSILNNELPNIVNTVPSNVFNTLSSYEKNEYSYIEDFSDLIFASIRRLSAEELREIHDVSEGIEYKLIKEANNTNSILELINNVKSKRYTRTRIQRILMKIVLNVKKDYIGLSGSLNPEYARVLSFNDKGKEIIKKIKKNSDIKLITNLRNLDYYKPSIKKMLEYDIKATNIYALKSNLAVNSDFFRHPIYIE
ncbi:nucleotidyltransferase [Helicovermis profundi]|uniref:tRNA(Met) cytidine acetate ligase n=1 Tax=Helicovermis profundi TaxID=3065157 RepID=A0AAU9EDH1_9FIRM|nr:nucleotidyltransferase [Clostridia bacterium S502]